MQALVQVLKPIPIYDKQQEKWTTVKSQPHYSDVTMDAIGSQITSLTIV